MINEKRIHFMHIPKTGGTSLYQFLEKQFKIEETCPYVYLRYAADWIAKEKILNNEFDESMKNYRFFKGHLGWVPRTFFLDGEIDTITFLRDPIARILSVYNAKRTHVHRHYISKNWGNFEDFADDEIFGLTPHANIQTKHFCADHYFKKSFSCPPPEQPISGTGGILSNYQIDLSPEQQLELAIKRLHNCSYVGMTEHYEESLQSLCLQYGWLPPKLAPMRNVSVKFAGKEDLHPKLIDRVLEANQLDLRLYQEALAIFNDRKKIRISCNYTEVANKISEQMATNAICFTFTDISIGEGWGPREGNSSNIYCWSMATRSTLVFSMKARTSLSLSFHVTHWLLPQFEEKLTLTVNSHPIVLTYHTHPQGGIIFKGIIPARAFNKDNTLLELAFVIPELIRPKDIAEESTDHRELGFACKEVNIKPLSRLQNFKYRVSFLWKKPHDNTHHEKR